MCIRDRLKTDPHLIYAIVMMLGTNLISISYAIFATRPELVHGRKEDGNLMFYGNFQDMTQEEYVESVVNLMDKGDELYKTIAKDTYYLGKTMNKKFKLLRRSFNTFLIGVTLSVAAFVVCHLLFGSF